MIYSGFASIYDRLMQDVPYEGWVRYLGRLFERFGIKPVEILDIGCGTGNVTIPLAEMGYSMTGLDFSPEMLSIAENKAREKGFSICWLQQDMRKADLGGKRFDLVISMTDSLNYLADCRELGLVFNRVKGLLKPGGWFIFDLNSAYKIREIFGSNVFTLLEDDIAYIWENDYDLEAQACNMYITFFVKEADGRYRRFSEQHRETGFETADVFELLKDAGFLVEGIFAEGSFEEPIESTERIYFVARAE